MVSYQKKLKLRKHGNLVSLCIARGWGDCNHIVFQAQKSRRTLRGLLTGCHFVAPPCWKGTNSRVLPSLGQLQRCIRLRLAAKCAAKLTAKCAAKCAAIFAAIFTAKLAAKLTAKCAAKCAAIFAAIFAAKLAAKFAANRNRMQRWSCSSDTPNRIDL